MSYAIYHLHYLVYLNHIRAFGYIRLHILFYECGSYNHHFFYYHHYHYHYSINIRHQHHHNHHILTIHIITIIITTIRHLS